MGYCCAFSTEQCTWASNGKRFRSFEIGRYTAALEKNVRKVILTCAVKEIRVNYSSEDGTDIPFKESTEDENRVENGK